MAIKFEKITPGMRLMDIHSHRMGNTMMRELGCWFVDIISVDTEKRTAVVRWNDNAPEVYHEYELTRLYTKEPKAYREQKARRARGGMW